jgi:CubicO group peptidase (beta-lactamase class C family)
METSYTSSRRGGRDIVPLSRRHRPAGNGFRLPLSCSFFLFRVDGARPAGTAVAQPDTSAARFPGNHAGQAGFCPERLDRLTDMLHGYAEQQRLSGGVVLVLRDGHAVVHEAFGKLDVASGTDMPRDALFRIASQTKAIISVAVMMLQEEGRAAHHGSRRQVPSGIMETTVAVEREDDPRGWSAVPANRPITIRDLLMHTAGISYGRGMAAEQWEEAGIQGWYLADRDEPVREIVRRMAALPFDAHPGERFVYGYANDILGVLIEEVSGMPLDRFLHERLFEPLGMHDTWFFVPEEHADGWQRSTPPPRNGGLSVRRIPADRSGRDTM